MNSRERVLAALNHQQPDRTPVDLGGMGSTGIMAVAYARFREFMGLEPQKVRINDVGQQLADIHEDMLQLWGADLVNINRSLAPCLPGLPPLMDYPLADLSKNPPEMIDAEMMTYGMRIERQGNSWVIYDGAGDIEFRKPDTAYYFERVKYQLGAAQSISDIAAYKWPLPPRKFFTELRKKAKWLRENTDYALMASFGGNSLEMGQCLRGWGQFMMDLGMGGAFRDYLLDFMCDRWFEMLGLYMEAIGDLIDVIVMGDDLGTQCGLQMSLDLYKQTVHPRHKRLYSYVREHYPNVTVFLHSCGAIRELMPLLIEEGVQALNPVQTSATGMDPAELKKEFGKDLVFWGGTLDTQHVLPLGTPEQVRAQVLERMKILGEGGGHIFCQIHNIQAQVPCENILAMVNAAREFNGLPQVSSAND